MRFFKTEITLRIYELFEISLCQKVNLYLSYYTFFMKSGNFLCEKTLFSSLKHIFQPHKPPYDTFVPKCGNLHFFKGIIYCTFVAVECIHAYYTPTEK